MGGEKEEVMYLKKSIGRHEFSNNRLIQILFSSIAMYIIVNSYEHRTEFDACYEHGVENVLHESSEFLKAAKEKGSDAETAYRLERELRVNIACNPKNVNN